MTLERALVVVALLAAYAGDLHARQTLRQGQKLPSGPPRYYLREGSPSEICAPYIPSGETKTHWSCQPIQTVIAKMLKDPPDCGDK